MSEQPATRKGSRRPSVDGENRSLIFDGKRPKHGFNLNPLNVFGSRHHSEQGSNGQIDPRTSKWVNSGLSSRTFRRSKHNNEVDPEVLSSAGSPEPNKLSKKISKERNPSYEANEERDPPSVSHSIQENGMNIESGIHNANGSSRPTQNLRHEVPDSQNQMGNLNEKKALDDFEFQKFLSKNYVPRADYDQLESDSSAKNRQFVEYKASHQAELERLKKFADTERSLREDNANLAAQLQKVSEKAATILPLKRQVSSMKLSLEESGRNYTAQNAELEARTSRLREVEGWYEDLQKRHLAASNELNRVNLESKSVLDDAFFTRKWYVLQSDIKAWADRYFWGPHKSKWSTGRAHEHPNPSIDLLRLSDDCKSLLIDPDDGSGRSLVAEAFLWSFIEENVFDGQPATFRKGLFWAHTLRSEYCRMESFMRPGRNASDAELRIFHKWRAITAKLLLSRLHSPSDTYRIPVASSILKTLADSVLFVLKPWLTGDLSRCLYDIESIFKSAIDFDSHVAEQCSDIYASSTPLDVVHRERHGFPYDIGLMEPATQDLQMQGNDKVGIVVSPALVRAGTENGDGFGMVSVLAKSRVLPMEFYGRSVRGKGVKGAGGMVTDSARRK